MYVGDVVMSRLSVQISCLNPRCTPVEAGPSAYNQAPEGSRSNRRLHCRAHLSFMKIASAAITPSTPPSPHTLAQRPFRMSPVEIGGAASGFDNGYALHGIWRLDRWTYLFLETISKKVLQNILGLGILLEYVNP